MLTAQLIRLTFRTLDSILIQEFAIQSCAHQSEEGKFFENGVRRDQSGNIGQRFANPKRQAAKQSNDINSRICVAQNRACRPRTNRPRNVSQDTSGNITEKITEPPVRVNHQEADDLFQLERKRFELSKSLRIVSGIKAKRICFDGFACIVLLSRDSVSCFRSSS